MASLAQHLGGLKWPPFSAATNKLSSSKNQYQTVLRKKRSVISAAVSTYAPDAITRNRRDLKDLFEESYEKVRTAPMGAGLDFTVEEFEAALDKYQKSYDIGSKVKGMVEGTDANGAYIYYAGKSAAFLPLEEASILRLKRVEQAGIVTGLHDEFLVIDEDQYDDTLILSLRKYQYDLAWERCRQLLAEDVVVKGKVVGGNKGGVMAMVEGLEAFIPFSHISSKVTIEEELLGKVLPLKFVEVDEEGSRLVMSNRKAVADSKAQLGIGSVVVGTVESLKPYGAFIDIGGISGLLHVSQISHDRVPDIETVLQPGDVLKVMVLSHDRERGRVSLSTKKLEPTPGDMIRNPTLVYEKAEEMAQTFRQRIAQAEAMARADMLRFQPESGLMLSSEGILGPLMSDSYGIKSDSYGITSDLPLEGLDLNETPLAESE